MNSGYPDILVVVRFEGITPSHKPTTADVIVKETTPSQTTLDSFSRHVPAGSHSVDCHEAVYLNWDTESFEIELKIGDEMTYVGRERVDVQREEIVLTRWGVDRTSNEGCFVKVKWYSGGYDALDNERKRSAATASFPRLYRVTVGPQYDLSFEDASKSLLMLNDEKTLHELKLKRRYEDASETLQGLKYEQALQELKKISEDAPKTLQTLNAEEALQELMKMHELEARGEQNIFVVWTSRMTFVQDLVEEIEASDLEHIRYICKALGRRYTGAQKCDASYIVESDPKRQQVISVPCDLEMYETGTDSVQSERQQLVKDAKYLGELLKSQPSSVKVYATMGIFKPAEARKLTIPEGNDDSRIGVPEAVNMEHGLRVPATSASTSSIMANSLTGTQLPASDQALIGAVNWQGEDEGENHTNGDDDSNSEDDGQDTTSATSCASMQTPTWRRAPKRCLPDGSLPFVVAVAQHRRRRRRRQKQSTKLFLPRVPLSLRRLRYRLPIQQHREDAVDEGDEVQEEGARRREFNITKTPDTGHGAEKLPIPEGKDDEDPFLELAHTSPRQSLKLFFKAEDEITVELKPHMIRGGRYKFHIGRRGIPINLTCVNWDHRDEDRALRNQLFQKNIPKEVKENDQRAQLVMLRRTKDFPALPQTGFTLQPQEGGDIQEFIEIGSAFEVFRPSESVKRVDSETFKVLWRQDPKTTSQGNENYPSVKFKISKTLSGEGDQSPTPIQFEIDYRETKRKVALSEHDKEFLPIPGLKCVRLSPNILAFVHRGRVPNVAQGTRSPRPLSDPRPSTYNSHCKDGLTLVSTRCVTKIHISEASDEPNQISHRFLDGDCKWLPFSNVVSHGVPIPAVFCTMKIVNKFSDANLQSKKRQLEKLGELEKEQHKLLILIDEADDVGDGFEVAAKWNGEKESSQQLREDDTIYTFSIGHRNVEVEVKCDGGVTFSGLLDNYLLEKADEEETQVVTLRELSEKRTDARCLRMLVKMPKRLEWKARVDLWKREVGERRRWAEHEKTLFLLATGFTDLKELPSSHTTFKLDIRKDMDTPFATCLLEWSDGKISSWKDLAKDGKNILVEDVSRCSKLSIEVTVEDDESEKPVEKLKRKFTTRRNELKGSITIRPDELETEEGVHRWMSVCDSDKNLFCSIRLDMVVSNSLPIKEEPIKVGEFGMWIKPYKTLSMKKEARQKRNPSDEAHGVPSKPITIANNDAILDFSSKWEYGWRDFEWEWHEVPHSVQRIKFKDGPAKNISDQGYVLVERRISTQEKDYLLCLLQKVPIPAFPDVRKPIGPNDGQSNSNFALTFTFAALEKVWRRAKVVLAVNDKPASHEQQLTGCYLSAQEVSFEDIIFPIRVEIKIKTTSGKIWSWDFTYFEDNATSPEEDILAGGCDRKQMKFTRSSDQKKVSGIVSIRWQWTPPKPKPFQHWPSAIGPKEDAPLVVGIKNIRFSYEKEVTLPPKVFLRNDTAIDSHGESGDITSDSELYFILRRNDVFDFLREKLQIRVDGHTLETAELSSILKLTSEDTADGVDCGQEHSYHDILKESVRTVNDPRACVVTVQVKAWIPDAKLSQRFDSDASPSKEDALKAMESFGVADHIAWVSIERVFGLPKPVSFKHLIQDPGTRRPHDGSDCESPFFWPCYEPLRISLKNSPINGDPELQFVKDVIIPNDRRLEEDGRRKSVTFWVEGKHNSETKCWIGLAIQPCSLRDEFAAHVFNNWKREMDRLFETQGLGMLQVSIKAIYVNKGSVDKDIGVHNVSVECGGKNSSGREKCYWSLDKKSHAWAPLLTKDGKSFEKLEPLVVKEYNAQNPIEVHLPNQDTQRIWPRSGDQCDFRIVPPFGEVQALVFWRWDKFDKKRQLEAYEGSTTIDEGANVESHDDKRSIPLGVISKISLKRGFQVPEDSSDRKLHVQWGAFRSTINIVDKSVNPENFDPKEFEVIDSAPLDELRVNLCISGTTMNGGKLQKSDAGRVMAVPFPLLTSLGGEGSDPDECVVMFSVSCRPRYLNVESCHPSRTDPDLPPGYRQVVLVALSSVAVGSSIYVGLGNEAFNVEPSGPNPLFKGRRHRHTGEIFSEGHGLQFRPVEVTNKKPTKMTIKTSLQDSVIADGAVFIEAQNDAKWNFIRVPEFSQQMSAFLFVRCTPITIETLDLHFKEEREKWESRTLAVGHRAIKLQQLFDVDFGDCDFSVTLEIRGVQRKVVDGYKSHERHPTLSKTCSFDNVSSLDPVKIVIETSKARYFQTIGHDETSSLVSFCSETGGIDPNVQLYMWMSHGRDIPPPKANAAEFDSWRSGFANVHQPITIVRVVRGVDLLLDSDKETYLSAKALGGAPEVERRIKSPHADIGLEMIVPSNEIQLGLALDQSRYCWRECSKLDEGANWIEFSTDSSSEACPHLLVFVAQCIQSAESPSLDHDDLKAQFPSCPLRQIVTGNFEMRNLICNDGESIPDTLVLSSGGSTGYFKGNRDGRSVLFKVGQRGILLSSSKEVSLQVLEGKNHISTLLLPVNDNQLWYSLRNSDGRIIGYVSLFVLAIAPSDEGTGAAFEAWQRNLNPSRLSIAVCIDRIFVVQNDRSASELRVHCWNSRKTVQQILQEGETTYLPSDHIISSICFQLVDGGTRAYEVEVDPLNDGYYEWVVVKEETRTLLLLVFVEFMPGSLSLYQRRFYRAMYGTKKLPQSINENDLDWSDHEGKSPLHVAAQNGLLSFITKIASITGDDLRQMFGKLDRTGQIPVFLALRYGNFACADYLLRHPLSFTANILNHRNDADHGIIHEAILSQSPDIVMLVLWRLPDRSEALSLRPRNSLPPIFFACREIRAEAQCHAIVQLLLLYGSPTELTKVEKLGVHGHLNMQISHQSTKVEKALEAWPSKRDNIKLRTGVFFRCFFAGILEHNFFPDSLSHWSTRQLSEFCKMMDLKRSGLEIIDNNVDGHRLSNFRENDEFFRRHNRFATAYFFLKEKLNDRKLGEMSTGRSAEAGDGAIRATVANSNDNQKHVLKQNFQNDVSPNLLLYQKLTNPLLQEEGIGAKRKGSAIYHRQHR